MCAHLSVDSCHVKSSLCVKFLRLVLTAKLFYQQNLVIKCTLFLGEHYLLGTCFLPGMQHHLLSTELIGQLMRTGTMAIMY